MTSATRPDARRHHSARGAARCVGLARIARLARVIAVALTLSAAHPRVALAHPLHTTVTDLRRAPDGIVTLRVRTFADDFSAAVARADRTTARVDHRVDDAAALAYVARGLTLQVAGRSLALRLVAQHRDGDVTWLELRATETVPSLRGARIVNRLLTEFHADQVNVVKASYEGRSFTTLFSLGEGAKALP